MTPALGFSFYSDAQVRCRNCISDNNSFRNGVFHRAKFVDVGVEYFRGHDRSRACSFGRRRDLRRFGAMSLYTCPRRFCYPAVGRTCGKITLDLEPNKPFQPDPRILAKPYPKNINADTSCHPCRRGILAALFSVDVDERLKCGCKRGIHGLALECQPPPSQRLIAASPQLLRELGYQPATDLSNFTAGAATGRKNNCLIQSLLQTAVNEPWTPKFKKNN